MASLPALTIWVDAYEADTSHLTYEEHGLYLKLLFLMWRSPDCRVPDDDTWLGRRMRLTAEQVPTLLRPIIAEFCQKQGGFLVQKKLHSIYKESVSYRENKRAAAKSRWDKEKRSSTSIDLDDAHELQGADPADEVHMPSSSSSISKPISKSNDLDPVPSQAPSRDDDQRVYYQVLALLKQEDTYANHLEFTSMTTRLGISHEVIVAAAKHHAAIGKTGRSLSYIRPKALELKQAADYRPAEIPAEFEPTDDTGWWGRLNYWKKNPTVQPQFRWLAKWGPMWDQPDTKCPEYLVVEFRKRESETDAKAKPEAA